MTHPADFYLVRRLYRFQATRHYAKSAEWDTVAVSATRDDALDAIDDAFRDEAPTLGNLYVLHVQADAPARVVTEDFIALWEIANAPSEDELIEQAICDRADDYAHMMAEERA